MNFIDRDPKEMIKKATEMKKTVGEMIQLIRGIEGVLDSEKNKLDGPTQKQIEELHKCCNEYLRHSDAYFRVAEIVETKGKKLDKIRNGDLL